MSLRLVRDGLGFHRRSASYTSHGPATGRENHDDQRPLIHLQCILLPKLIEPVRNYRTMIGTTSYVSHIAQPQIPTLRKFDPLTLVIPFWQLDHFDINVCMNANEQLIHTNINHNSFKFSSR